MIATVTTGRETDHRIVAYKFCATGNVRYSGLSVGSAPLVLSDNIGDSFLGRYEHDLVPGHEEFERFNLRDLLDHQRRKRV